MKWDLPRCIVLSVLLPLVGACSGAPPAPATTMTYDRQFDFSEIRKIYIQASSRTDAASITVSDAQIERIDSALARELDRRGFQLVSASEQADLFLSWLLVTRDPVAGSSDCVGCDRSVDSEQRYSKGTLVVDMIDPMRNQAVWRSVLQTELSGEPGTARAEQARLAAAAAIFAGFPPQ